MKLNFTLAAVSGVKLVNIFKKSINEEMVGFDPDWSGSTGGYCSLSEDGTTWVTAWSGFKYEILNPESSDGAVVQYDGAWRGFLAQNLLPEELRGETIGSAEVIEGSALAKHEVEKFVHTDASDLVKAYGLMQTASGGQFHPEALKVCLSAIEAARQIHEHLRSAGAVMDSSFAYAGPNSGGHGCINTNDGDPAVYVTCCPGGEQVKLEIQLHPWGEDSTAEGTVKRAVKWIDNIKSVL